MGVPTSPKARGNSAAAGSGPVPHVHTGHQRGGDPMAPTDMHGLSGPASGAVRLAAGPKRPAGRPSEAGGFLSPPLLLFRRRAPNGPSHHGHGPGSAEPRHGHEGSPCRQGPTLDRTRQSAGVAGMGMEDPKLGCAWEVWAPARAPQTPPSPMTSTTTTQTMNKKKKKKKKKKLKKNLSLSRLPQGRHRKNPQECPQKTKQKITLTKTHQANSHLTAQRV